MSTTPAQLLEKSLLELWNERDPSRRMEIMKVIYAPEIIFFESDTSKIQGYEAINAAITGLQTNWPADFAFRLINPAESNHNFAHAAWVLGAANAEPVAAGRDIAVVENGQIKLLYLFLDKV